MNRALALIIAALAALALNAGASAAGRPQATATALWAVVNTDGTLARGSGAVSSSQLGTDGYYTVTFNRDVSACAYTATGGAASASDVLDDAVIFTAQPATNPAGVLVLEYDAILGADSYSSGFHLVIAC